MITILRRAAGSSEMALMMQGSEEFRGLIHMLNSYSDQQSEQMELESLERKTNRSASLIGSTFKYNNTENVYKNKKFNLTQIY